MSRWVLAIRASMPTSRRRLRLKRNKKALATYEAFRPSHKREYVEWVTEAKSEATRERRLADAVAWIAEGKPRNWKYMK